MFNRNWFIIYFIIIQHFRWKWLTGLYNHRPCSEKISANKHKTHKTLSYNKIFSSFSARTPRACDADTWIILLAVTIHARRSSYWKMCHDSNWSQDNDNFIFTINDQRMKGGLSPQLKPVWFPSHVTITDYSSSVQTHTQTEALYEFLTAGSRSLPRTNWLN